MKTNTFETDWLKLYFQNVPIANVGDATGLRGSTVAGSLYVSMHTTYPGEGGSQLTGECVYSGYARKAVVRDTVQWIVSGNQVTNANIQTFPQATGGVENAYFYGIGRAASGAGVMDYIVPMGVELGEGTAFPATDVITIPGLAGVLANDEIAFFAEPKVALPAPLVAGTIYFVKTISGNDITVSATAGGATIDITAAGGVIAYKMVKIAISTGVTPFLPASTGILVKEE